MKFQIELLIYIIIIISCLILLLTIVCFLYKFYCLKFKTKSEYETVLETRSQQQEERKNNIKKNNLVDLVEVNFINFLIVLNKKLNLVNNNNKKNLITKSTSTTTLPTTTSYCPNEYIEIPDKNQSNLNIIKKSSSKINYNNEYGTTAGNSSNFEIEIPSTKIDLIDSSSNSNSSTIKMFKFDNFITNIKNMLQNSAFNKDIPKAQLIINESKIETEKDKTIKLTDDGLLKKKIRFKTTADHCTRASPQHIRRYSIIEENICDKFWVPEEIAINSQQRCSLPTYTSQYSNEAFKNSDSSINSMEHNRSMFDRRESIPIGSSNGSSLIGSNNNIINNHNNNNGGLRRASTITSSTKGRRASMFDPIDPTELQKTLYQNQVNRDSLTNIGDATTTAATTTSTVASSADFVGMLEIGLEYTIDKSKLIVDIIRCFDLQPKDFSDIADPYCKCTLMPDKITQQTKVSRKTLNPIFEETFEFDIEREFLENHFLLIEIYDYEKFSKNESIIGHVKIQLNNSNVENKKILLKELRPSIKIVEEEDIGDLMFSLAYLPGAERLTIVIMKARNLKGLGVTKKTAPDPFVKVCLQSKDGKRHKKKKTSTQKYTMNPVYNEEVVFTNITKDQLYDLDIKLMIFHDSITSRELLGYVELNSSSKGNEYEHWKDMIDGKKSIGWWHQLKTYPYVYKNSLTNVLSHYHNLHHHHHGHHQSTRPQQSSNDDIEEVCDNTSNNIIIKNINEATVTLTSLVLSPTSSTLQQQTSPPRLVNKSAISGDKK